MGISRKDTIIIAVLVNVALLATLFSLGKERRSEKEELQAVKTEKTKKLQVPIRYEREEATPPVDEIDAVLLEYEKLQNKNAQIKSTTKKSTQPEGEEFYLIQNGDNPWKIARKFHLKYEDLLTLNNLDEEKARQLKIGQKIRIR